jgi:AcrR family transcriptional regulator
VREAAAQATRDSILKAATKVFAKYGYDGGSVEKISKAAKSYDRMIYYYFGSKEGLFIAVLEGIYKRMDDAEAAIALDASRPVEALTEVIRFVLGYYRKNPEFVTLLNTENLHKGRHISKSLRAREYSSRAVAIIAEILASGSAQGLFRKDLVARDIYLLIASTGYFYTSNRHTLTAFPRRAAGVARGDHALGKLRDRDRAAHRARRRGTRQQHPTPRGPHEMAEIAAGGKSGKVVIKNIGLLLSGDIDKPILDADTIVVNDGLIVAVGKEKDCDLEGAQTVIDAKQDLRGARPDRQPRAPGVRRLDAAPGPDRLDRLDHARRRDHHDFRRRSAPARSPERHRRPEGAGHHRAACVRQLPPRRREGAGRRAGHRERHGRERLQGTGRSRRGPARRSGPGLGEGRLRGQGDGGLGAQVRHPEHDPHGRPVDPGLGPDRQGRGARGRRRHHRPHQRRPHLAARGACVRAVREEHARHRDRAQRQRERSPSRRPRRRWNSSARTA